MRTGQHAEIIRYLKGLTGMTKSKYTMIIYEMHEVSHYRFVDGFSSFND